jgi:GAF domain-containing protein
LGEKPDPEFDEFAKAVATDSGARFAMVNFIDEHRQFFAGLYPPDMGQPVREPGAPPPPPSPEDPGRVMRKDQGWCPHVVVRRLPLVLDDVCDYPRFAGNPVVDEIGIRTYLGAPLIDRTGTALGTICVVDLEPRPWGRPGLEFIKARAAQVVDLIHLRERQRW